MTTLTVASAVAVLAAAALLAYIADRGLCNAVERLGIACLIAARRMRARREAVAEQQALTLAAMHNEG